MAATAHRRLMSLGLGGVTAALAVATGLGGTTAGASSLTAATTTPRAATLIGAMSVDFSSANATIGPVQTERIFYPHQLPTTYAKSAAASLPAGITAIISYKTPTTNVKSFVASIPSSRAVIMTFHHEPEGGLKNGDFASGPQFVAEFEQQSTLIRSVHKANVKVAMIAGSYQYVVGSNHDNGGDGAYLPPAKYVDMYCVDNYEKNPDGKGLASDPDFLGWYNQVKTRGKPLCITEYGLNSNGTAAGNSARVATMKADDIYLASKGDFVVWEYWWDNMGMTTQQAIASEDNWQFTDAGSIAEWHLIENAKASGTTPPPTPTATPRPTATPTATPRPTAAPTATPRPTPTPTSAPTPLITQLAVSPARLVSGGDNSSLISFELASPATVTVDVTLPSGTVVGHILTNESKHQGHISQQYFGYNGSGSRLPAGSYDIRVTATAASGKQMSALTPLSIVS